MHAFPFRIGQGFDVHVLVEGRPLILGGISIPFEKGLLGHSDADALLHAITDALLGAAGLGDIGQHFPDTDPAYHNVSSRILLQTAMNKIREAGWEVVNIDATIHAQRPKLSSYLPAMIRSIAKDLNIEASAINLKAKTGEGLGYVGRQEGIEANAVVLLVRS